MTRKALYSTSEVAKIFHLSRVEIFRKIRSGKIKAEKIGRNYVIPYESIAEALGENIGINKKIGVDRAINKAIREYGDVFKNLGKE